MFTYRDPRVEVGNEIQAWDFAHLGRDYFKITGKFLDVCKGLVRDIHSVVCRRYIVLICISYGGELASVENDLRRLLEDLNYWPNDPRTDCRILADFGCKYRGKTLHTIPPTAENIEKEIRRAAKHGTSVLICFGGHGGHTKGQSYIVSVDKKHIFGSEFRKWLTLEPSTVTELDLECCDIGNFLTDLPFVYTGVDPPPPQGSGDIQSKGHLIVVTAAKINQEAGPVKLNDHDPKERYGAMRWFMSEYYRDLRGREPASAGDFVKIINDNIKKTQGLAVGKSPQEVQVSSSHELRGPFRLLMR